MVCNYSKYGDRNLGTYKSKQQLNKMFISISTDMSTNTGEKKKMALILHKFNCLK